MKAVGVEGKGDDAILRVVETPLPDLAEDSVRIAVSAAGLNRADLLQRRGLYPPPPGAPETLGLECAGTVVEVAAGVGKPKTGDRVMALVPGGGQAEQAVVHRGSLMPVPGHFSDEEAGAFPEVFLTAHLNLFMLGDLAAGRTALVHGGSGGVGTAAIALARLAGARIVVTAGSSDRCRRCLDLGADAAVNYRDDDFEAVCLELTGGAGVDVVLDCIGGPYLEKNLRVLAMDGRLVAIGLMGGPKAELDMRRLLTRRLRVIGSTLRALAAARKAEIVSSFLDRFGDAIADGRLRPVIDSVYPMERVAEAHARLASGEAFGKVVLSVP
ncbi:MAG: NAD(P)H-quinone oxidoreductase [Candidatus Sulfomarinibacteraceae bacterium]